MKHTDNLKNCANQNESGEIVISLSLIFGSLVAITIFVFEIEALFLIQQYLQFDLDVKSTAYAVAVADLRSRTRTYNTSNNPHVPAKISKINAGFAQRFYAATTSGKNPTAASYRGGVITTPSSTATSLSYPQSVVLSGIRYKTYKWLSFVVGETKAIINYDPILFGSDFNNKSPEDETYATEFKTNMNPIFITGQ